MNDRGRRIRIALLTPQDPLSKRSWSGTIYHMARALQEQCGEVTLLGPVPGTQRGGRICNRLTQLLLGKRYDYSHSLSYARTCARYFTRKLAAADYDIIFAPAAATGLAFLTSGIPIVYASDATFALLHNYYPEFSNLLPRSIRWGNLIEKAAIQKSRIALFSSQWAAESACTDYGADPAKIRIIPFGANLDTVPPKNGVALRKKSAKVSLLFLAVNWQRKGGDIALATLGALLDRGIAAELIVCGCQPPAGVSHPCLTVIPFLDKDNPQERNALNDLFQTTDFLLLPTRYDCTPIVICEANAFGVPVLATDTGGVSSLINEGENGLLLPFSAKGAHYADAIAKVIHDEECWSALRHTSRAAFDERLNWDAWARSVGTLFAEILEEM